MSTSPTPWSTCAVPAGTNIVDASGKHIGGFWDYRDAEKVLALFDEVEALKERVAELEVDLEKAPV